MKNRGQSFTIYICAVILLVLMSADVHAGLIYSTFIGGTDLDHGYGIDVDSAGNVYVTGVTSSVDFPTVTGAYGGTLRGNADIFVCKLNASGSALMFSTYIGGSDMDVGATAESAIDVDLLGFSYVTGITLSTDFPTTAGAFDKSHNGGVDMFVVKLSADGANLIYSTYLGGAGDEGDEFSSSDIVVDDAGYAYVSGSTKSTDYPTTSGVVYPVYGGSAGDYGDCVVTKLNTDGTGLVYSTYIGGTGGDAANAIALDSSGNVYITGETQYPGFPTTSGCFDGSYNGGLRDSFITKVNDTATSLVYSTFLGGMRNDYGYGIVVDSSGNAYVTGVTNSLDFPMVPDSYDMSYNGGSFKGDVFVSKMNPGGSDLVYSTYVGGLYDEIGLEIGLDSVHSVFVTGKTDSNNFPTTPDALDKRWNGNSDAFLFALNQAGTALQYSTYIGWAAQDEGLGLVVDNTDNVYLTGMTFSLKFPTTPGAYDRSYNENGDAFVCKFEFSTPPVRCMFGNIKPVLFILFSIWVIWFIALRWKIF